MDAYVTPAIVGLANGEGSVMGCEDVCATVLPGGTVLMIVAPVACVLSPEE